MPTLPSGQTSTCFRIQMSSLGGPASGSPSSDWTVCSVWAVVSDLPADMFPSFEAGKPGLAECLLFCANLSLNFLLAGSPSW